MRLRDAALTASGTGTTSIVLDYDAPTLASISLASTAPVGSTISRSTTIRVSFAESDVAPGVVREVLLSEDAAFAGATWQPFVEPLVFTLSSLNGTKTVYAQLRDAVGRTSVTRSASIVLDTQPPVATSVVLRHPVTGSGAYTADALVNVVIAGGDNVSTGADLAVAIASGSNLVCADGATVYGDSLAGCTGSPCTATRAFSVPAVNGSQEVSVCLKDAAGNVSAVPATGSIVYDGDDPPVVVGLNTIPGSRQIEVSWVLAEDNGPAGISHYELSYSSNGNSTRTILEVYGDSALITGLTNRVEHLVQVRAVDRAGRRSSNYSSAAFPIPGFARALVSDPLGDRESAAPNVIEADGYLYVFAAETRSATSDYFSVSRCNTRVNDCRSQGAWTKLRYTGGARELELQDSSGGAEQPMPVALTSSRLYVGVMENDGAGGYVPAVWSCLRGAGCEAGTFTRTVVGAASSFTIPAHLALTANGTRLYLAWFHYQNGVEERPRVSSCGLATDCTLPASWVAPVSIPGVLDAVATYQGNNLALAASETSVWLVYNRPGTRESWVSRCSTSTDCNAAGEWSAGFALDGADNGDVNGAVQAVVTRDNLFITSFDYPALRIFRCPLSTGCSVAASFGSNTVVGYAYLDGNGRHRLEHGVGAVQLTWYDPTYERVKLLACREPDRVPGAPPPLCGNAIMDPGEGCEGPGVGTCAADCQPLSCLGLASFGAPLVVDVVLLATQPAVASFDNNVALLWMDDTYRLQARLSPVLAPGRHGTAPGVGELRGSWSARGPVSGYEHLFREDTEPSWSRSVVGDPVIQRSEVPAPSAAGYLSTVLAFDATGQLSDEAPSFAVRPFVSTQAIGTASALGAPDPAICTTSLSGAQRQCSYYSAAASGTRLLHLYTSANDLILTHCDTAALDCNVAFNWTKFEFATGTYFPGGVAATSTTVYATAQDPNQDIWAFWCDLSTGCDAAGEWSSHQVVNSAVTLVDERDPRIAIGGNRVWIASRETAGTNEVRLHHCSTAADCTQAANWVKDVPVTSGTTEYRGHSIAVGSTYVGIVAVDGANIDFYRCVASQLGCDSNLDISTTNVVSTAAAAIPLEHSAQISMLSGDRPAFAAV